VLATSDRVNTGDNGFPIDIGKSPDRIRALDICNFCEFLTELLTTKSSVPAAEAETEKLADRGNRADFTPVAEYSKSPESPAPLETSTSADRLSANDSQWPEAAKPPDIVGSPEARKPER
jgi:hypothetical protein